MVSGAASANVATTGSFTIPMMIGIGYKPKFAGGCEAASSTGGQIMPPIMGAAAFVMAEFLGIAYGTVAISAVVCAILYYFSLFLMVHLYSKKHGMTGIESDLTLIGVLRQKGYMLVPICRLLRYHQPLSLCPDGLVIRRSLPFPGSPSQVARRIDAGHNHFPPDLLYCLLLQ
jgi:TRAP-type uncharacterized transport system fused permease subunit